jgi:hypothetical protein
MAVLNLPPQPQPAEARQKMEDDRSFQYVSWVWEVWITKPGFAPNMRYTVCLEPKL